MIANPYIGSYVFPTGDELMTVELARVGEIRDGTFHGDADAWAIRWMKRCWNSAGEWEYEPLPSSRDDAFRARTRFSFEDGFARAHAARDAVAAAYTRTQRPLDGELR